MTKKQWLPLLIVRILICRKPRLHTQQDSKCPELGECPLVILSKVSPTLVCSHQIMAQMRSFGYLGWSLFQI